MGIKASDVRKGNVLVIDGELYLVTDFQHIAPGNWRAMNQIKCKHLQTGTVKQMRLGSSENVEVAYLERRKATYLYKEGDHYVFMDSENYEQYHLAEDLVGEQMKFVRENQAVEVTFYEESPISMDLPGSVVLKIVEAELAVKGDSVTNDKKNAVAETGLNVRVPMHINQDEYVKISTQTGEFLSRAKAEEAE